MAEQGSGTALPVQDRIGHHVKRAEQALMARKSQALRQVGLTVAQYSALLVLADHPGMSGAQVARSCYVTPQTMATILANLMGKGLIVRHSSSVHAQVMQTELTPAGRTLLRDADRLAVEIERRLAAALEAEEESRLIALLERVTSVLEATGPGDPPRRAGGPHGAPDRPEQSACQL